MAGLQLAFMQQTAWTCCHLLEMTVIWGASAQDRDGLTVPTTFADAGSQACFQAAQALS